MSRLYHLLCVDCGEVLSLGKVARRDERGQLTPSQVGRFGDYDRASAAWSWTGGEQLWRLVQRFMMLHRGHELRVIPFELLDTIDPDGRLSHVIDYLSEFRQRQIDPEPDGEADLAAFPRDVIEGLKRRIAQLPKQQSEG